MIMYTVLYDYINSKIKFYGDMNDTKNYSSDVFKLWNVPKKNFRLA